MSNLPDPSYDETELNEQEESKQQTTNTKNPPKSEWEKYLDSLDDSRANLISKLAKDNKYIIEGNEYTRKKIKFKQFTELEILRARFTKEKDPVKAAQYLLDTYVKCAEFYLGISKEEFEEMDWEVTKSILDACNLRTIRGPN